LWVDSVKDAADRLVKKLVEAMTEANCLRLAIAKEARPDPLPPWLKIAYTYLGEKEIRGKGHNPKIVGFWGTIRLPGIRDDETPWCAAFQGAIHEQAGYASTRKGNAQSYKTWGVPCRPCVGATVVFWRGSPKSWRGHVGTLVGVREDGYWLILGGNQGNAVSISAYPPPGHKKSRVLGTRWPKGYPLPTNYELPIGYAHLTDGNEA
jgi:uncharacterized protein (TIGR02594 family)